MVGVSWLCLSSLDSFLATVEVDLGSRLLFSPPHDNPNLWVSPMRLSVRNWEGDLPSYPIRGACESPQSSLVGVPSRIHWISSQASEGARRDLTGVGNDSSVRVVFLIMGWESFLKACWTWLCVGQRYTGGCWGKWVSPSLRLIDLKA